MGEENNIIRRPITPEERGVIRQNLIDRKTRLWNEILHDMDREAKQKHQDIVDLMRENGDRALEELRENNALAFVRKKANELDQIEEALKRMESGDYGRCMDCGRWIRPARLEIRPFAIRCIKCKEQKEKFDSI